MLDGILWVLNTGVQWRDLPERFGPRGTAWDRFDTWNHGGTLVAILQRLQGEVEVDDELWCIDGTTVRAHKCASGGEADSRGRGTRRSRRTMRRAAAAVV